MDVRVIKQSETEWSVEVDGIPFVDRESYTVANHIADHLRDSCPCFYSESREVADSIMDWIAKS